MSAYPGRPIPSWNPDEIERNGGIETQGWPRGSVTLWNADDGPAKPWPWQLSLPERIAALHADIACCQASAARNRRRAQEPGASMWCEIAARADDASAASARRQIAELTHGLESEG